MESDVLAPLTLADAAGPIFACRPDAIPYLPLIPPQWRPATPTLSDRLLRALYHGRLRARRRRWQLGDAQDDIGLFMSIHIIILRQCVQLALRRF